MPRYGPVFHKFSVSPETQIQNNNINVASFPFGSSFLFVYFFVLNSVYDFGLSDV